MALIDDERFEAAQRKIQRIIDKQSQSLKKERAEKEKYRSQLEYVFFKSELFSQQSDWRSLFSTLFDSLRELLPKSEIIVSDVKDDKIIPMSFTSLFYWEEVRTRCLRDPRDDLKDKKDIFIKKWTEKSYLSSIFPGELKKHPCYLKLYLISSGKTYGVVQIFMPASLLKKYQEQILLLNTLKIQAGAALEKIWHYQVSQSGTRIKNELEVARDIQENFIPADPEFPGFRIKSYCEPAYRVGGDYLDYFQNDFGDWIFVIADVSGKGIPAALIMTTLRSTFRNEGIQSHSSSELLIRVNERILPDLQHTCRFITCLCLIVDKFGRRINYSHAGHPMLISYRNKDKQPREISTSGIALGLVSGEDFKNNIEEKNLEVKSGDRFLAYSDGLTETMNTDDKLYGTDRLLSLIKRSTELEPEDLINRIRRDLISFSNGRRQFDDLTMFALEKI